MAQAVDAPPCFRAFFGGMQVQGQAGLHSLVVRDPLQLKLQEARRVPVPRLPQLEPEGAGAAGAGAQARCQRLRRAHVCPSACMPSAHTCRLTTKCEGGTLWLWHWACDAWHGMAAFVACCGAYVQAASLP